MLRARPWPRAANERSPSSNGCPSRARSRRASQSGWRRASAARIACSLLKACRSLSGKTRCCATCRWQWIGVIGSPWLARMARASRRCCGCSPNWIRRTGASSFWPRTRPWATTRRTSPKRWTSRARCSTRCWPTRPVAGALSRCVGCSRGFYSPRMTCSSSSAHCRAARRVGLAWPSCCSSRANCCCSTSRPITWTCRPKTSSKKRSTITRVRSSSHRTIASCSIEWPPK